MEYIVLIYTNEVHSLVSSALQKHINKPLDNIELRVFNAHTQKFNNYIKKYQVDKIYLHSRYHKRIKEDIEILTKGLIPIIEYDSDIEFSPIRLKGNKFKTIEYYLYEYIKYNGKHVTKVYMIKDLDIVEAELDLFDRMFPHVKCKVYYNTREEARRVLETKIEKEIQRQYDLIDSYVEEIGKLAERKAKAEERIKYSIQALIKERDLKL